MWLYVYITKNISSVTTWYVSPVATVGQFTRWSTSFVALGPPLYLGFGPRKQWNVCFQSGTHNFFSCPRKIALWPKKKIHVIFIRLLVTETGRSDYQIINDLNCQWPKPFFFVKTPRSWLNSSSHHPIPGRTRAAVPPDLNAHDWHRPSEWTPPNSRGNIG